MKKISLLPCTSYSLETIKERIIESLDNIDFKPESFKGKRIGLKPNLLTAIEPEKAVVTHPVFFHAAAQVVKEHGGIPVLIESPAVLSLERVIKKTGYKQVIDDENIEIPEQGITRSIRFEDNVKYKKFDISNYFFDVDLIVNLPKLKTHGLMYYTGAVKNLFGSIPGGNKAQCHVKAKTPAEFTVLLLDLYNCLLKGFETEKPIVHLMDAIVGMDGEGPGASGNPRDIGAILAGTDAIALDFIAVNIVGLDIEKVLTVTEGTKRGLGSASHDEISVVGKSIDDFKIDDFEPSSSANTGLMDWAFNSPLFKKLFIEKPVPLEETCILCYQCKNICPAGAISTAVKKKKIPTYDYDKCIRCYCCMEICPVAAITAKKGALQWIWGRGRLLDLFID